jgi:hypothetical protein
MASDVLGLDDNDTPNGSETKLITSIGRASNSKTGLPVTSPPTTTRVKLDVGGVLYSTSLITLRAFEPTSALARMFTQPFSITPEGMPTNDNTCNSRLGS